MNHAVGQSTAVCVVGVGAVTAVGLTAPAAAAAVRAGISGFEECSYIQDRQGEPAIVAAVPKSEGDVIVGEWLAKLAETALREALLPLEAHRLVEGIKVILGLPPPRPGRPADLERQMTYALTRIEGIGSVECISAGHSAGLMAVEAASLHLQRNPSELYLAGGVDSYLHPDTLEWLENNEQLHCGPNAYGFIPGEAAGFCLICSENVAIRLKLPILARLLTAATARESNLIKTETVCLGQGLTEVLRKVFSDLPSTTERIEYSICDMNGETYRADEYGFAVSRLSQRFVNASNFVAPADCWGDVGAASGPLFVNLVIAAHQRGYSNAYNSLVWTSSEGGERSAAILNPV